MPNDQTNRNGSDAVVVVGAGIVGVCTAWHLLRRGANVTLIDRDEPGLGCSYGNAGAVSFGSVAPLAMPGVMRDALRMLLDPAAPLRIPLSYLPKAAPWLLAVRARVAARRGAAHCPDACRHCSPIRSKSMSKCCARSVHRKSCAAPASFTFIPTRSGFAKDAMSWALRREHGLRVERLERGDILALEPEVGPDYTVGMFTPDQGMSINPYRQVTAIASDFARRGGRIVRDRVIAIEVEADRVRAVRGEKRTYACRSCGDLRGRMVRRNCSPAWATPSRSRASAAITSQSPSPGIDSGAAGRCGGPKGLSHADGGRTARRRHRRIRRAGAGSDAQARRISRARPGARVSARENSGRLVVLDGTPSMPSRLAAGHGAKPPSRPVAQFRPRPSGTDDVGTSGDILARAIAASRRISTWRRFIRFGVRMANRNCFPRPLPRHRRKPAILAGLNPGSWPSRTDAVRRPRRAESASRAICGMTVNIDMTPLSFERFGRY